MVTVSCASATPMTAESIVVPSDRISVLNPLSAAVVPGLIADNLREVI